MKNFINQQLEAEKQTGGFRRTVLGPSAVAERVALIVLTEIAPETEL